MKAIARRVVLVLLLFLFATGNLLTQETIPAVKPTQQTSNERTSIQKKIDLINAQMNLAEAEKNRILNAYHATQNNFDELSSIEQRTLETQNQLQKLPTTIEQLEGNIKIIETETQDQTQEQLSNYASNELNQRLVIEKSNLNTLQSSINQLETMVNEQLKQPQQIREHITEAKEALVKTENELATLKTIKNKLEREARKSQITSFSNKVNASLTLLDLENIVYPLRLESMNLKLDLLKLERKQLLKVIEHIDDFFTKTEQKEFEEGAVALIQAHKEAASKHKVIQIVTRENIRYTQLLRDISAKEGLYLESKNKIEIRNKQLEKDFQSAEKKIELAGLSPSLGNLLRDQRRNLPLAKNYRKQIDMIHYEIAQAGLEQLKLDEVKKDLGDIDQAVRARISTEVSNRIGESEILKIYDELEKLLGEQKELILKLSTAYTEYSVMLADIDFSLQQLISLGKKFNSYLNERLLWVPSAPVINKHYLLEIYQSILWINQTLHWRQVAVDIRQSINSESVLALLGILTISLLIFFRQRINGNLEKLLERCRKIYSDRFVFTFYGLGYVFLLVLPLPLIMALVGWLLHMNVQVTAFSHAVAIGLLTAAVPLFIMQFLYLLFMPRGVAQSMLDWQEHSIQLLRQQLKWARFVFVPLMFLIGLFADQLDSKHSYSLGRMAFIIAMLATAYIFHRFAHPEKGLGKDFYQANPNNWLCHFRHLWYIIMLIAPLIIIGFAIAGYYQSALELRDKLVVVLRLIFFSVLLHSIVMRWLMLTNRHLALQNARMKRKLLDHAEDKDKINSSVINTEEKLLLDIPKINKQSEKLLNTTIFVFVVIGSGVILRDIFPALFIFDQVVLWQHMTLIDGQEMLQPITLVNVFVSFVYLLLMIIFIKNFPSLIDLFCAGKFSMSAGSRYAMIQLTCYTVIMITFIVITDELGGSWSQVQWLVAAMGVGLGFGLQEIFANMVSGIILLFERPIRVGDTVTVGDISGKVTRIQIRATTIVDWDQKELIVPNKIFITDKLVNWTLTDPVTRVVIPIGIAYGADEEKAVQIIEQVMDESQFVLKEPKPAVFLLGFGDSSLNFSVRVFVRDMDDRLPVTDEIHRKIRRAFKVHNIEIPFPQRDLHIRSTC